MDPVDVALARLAPRWAGRWPGHAVAAEAAAVRNRFDEAVRAWGVSDDAELAGEASALEAWRTSGAAVRLLDRCDGGATLLLERLRPGTMLDETGVGVAERLGLLGSLARRLHRAAPPPADLQTMNAFARPWRRALADRSDAVAELDALCAPADEDVVVHVDLHRRNVLRDGERWVVIDPRGARAAVRRAHRPARRPRAGRPPRGGAPATDGGRAGVGTPRRRSVGAVRGRTLRYLRQRGHGEARD